MNTSFVPLPMRRLWLFLAAAALTLSAPLAAQTGWQAAVARAEITPTEPMWMTGYGSRNRPADAKAQELWVKALALADPSGTPSVLFTADLCGITEAISDHVAAALEQSHGLPRSAVMINVSHTHSGPYIEGYLPALAEIPPADWEVIVRYRKELEATMIRTGREALGRLEPAQLAWAQDSADFAVNRRNNREAEVPALRAAGQLRGPVDHDVPVLRVTTPAGDLKAVVFGYACHNTVLGEYFWHGDYAGSAQIAVEERHPGATALYFIGCGADINPLPRRSRELADQYGEQLADAVDRALASRMTPIGGRFGSAYRVIDLPFQRVPTREELAATARNPEAGRYDGLRARHLLAKAEREGGLSPTHPYQIQVWKLGPGLTFVALAGEIVVDYALRLKRELGPNTFVAGYSSDVMGYIPSERVLKEGGYEGGGSMVVYGMQSPWAPGLEDKIVGTVKELAESLR